MDRPGVKTIFQTTLRKSFFKCSLLALYASLPWMKEHSSYSSVGDFSSITNAAFAFSLGIMLVLLLNRSYDRWWEARTQLGTLVNSSRNLAIKIKTNPSLCGKREDGLFDLIQTFPDQLRNHLLPLASQRKTECHEPNRTVYKIYQLLSQSIDDQSLTEVGFLQIDRDLSRFLDVCGACERIRNTRIPSSIRTITFYMVWLYLLFLPWGIVDALPELVFPATLLISFIVLSIYELSLRIAEPFSGDVEALDSERIIAVIRDSVLEIKQEFKSA